MPRLDGSDFHITLDFIFFKVLLFAAKKAQYLNPEGIASRFVRRQGNHPVLANRSETLGSEPKSPIQGRAGKAACRAPGRFGAVSGF
jgi:hypothetical protein